MLTEPEKLCVELEGLMAEKQDLDVKIADTLCKVHRYLCEQEGKGMDGGGICLDDDQVDAVKHRMERTT